MCRPQDGQTRRRFFSSRALFCRPATVISQPMPRVAAASVNTWGSNVIEIHLPRGESLKRFAFWHADVPGNTTRGVSDRIRGCTAPWSRDRRVRASLERSGGQRRLRGGGSRRSAGAGGGERAPARARLLPLAGAG